MEILFRQQLAGKNLRKSKFISASALGTTDCVEICIQYPEGPSEEILLPTWKARHFGEMLVSLCDALETQKSVSKDF